MSAMDMRELDSAGVSVPGQPGAEAVATSRDPHHWGRAMAVAISKLADQLASEDGHEALVGRDLRLRITTDPDGVRITVWCLPKE
ncbi:hypothetical protein [Arthrobacter sp. efr-133-R2A-120]|uniref:hypothetical protein n=1 Tax=Arthrobacter sp. efr-133-R2A-120 TaxID=3040277 RepID=UPI00254C8E18|nr:hypothetical protein [Arthrobacter sp. efr-133-R2A-120]